jgi:hypothetical protein
MISRLDGVAPLRHDVRLRALEAARQAALPRLNPRRRVSWSKALQARFQPPTDRSGKNRPL